MLRRVSRAARLEPDAGRAVRRSCAALRPSTAAAASPSALCRDAPPSARRAACSSRAARRCRAAAPIAAVVCRAAAAPPPARRAVPRPPASWFSSAQFTSAQSLVCRSTSRRCRRSLRSPRFRSSQFPSVAIPLVASLVAIPFARARSTPVAPGSHGQFSFARARGTSVAPGSHGQRRRDSRAAHAVARARSLCPCLARIPRPSSSFISYRRPHPARSLVPDYTVVFHSTPSPSIPLARSCPVHTVALTFRSLARAPSTPSRSKSVRSFVQFRSLVSPVVPPVALFGAADAPSRRVPRPSSAGTLYGFAVIARIGQLRHGGAAHRSFRSCGLERASPDPDRLRLGFRSCGDLGK